MKKIEYTFEGSTLSEKEKLFIDALMNDEVTKVSYLKDSYSPELSDFGSILRNSTSKNWDRYFLFFDAVRRAMSTVGFLEIPEKVIRAIELIGSGRSIRIVENKPELWLWSEYYGRFHHEHYPQLIRDEKDGPIFIPHEIHNFPKPDYGFFQGYADCRLVRRNEFPIDPLTVETKIFYYVTPWDGRGNFSETVKTAIKMENPEYRKGWLAIQRTAFEEKEAAIRALETKILDGDSVV